MKYLTEEEIYVNLKYLEAILDKKENLELGHDVVNHIKEISSNMGLSSYTMASAMYNYQSKKTPASVALRDWSREVCDVLSKKLNAMQSVLSILKLESRDSKFQ